MSTVPTKALSSALVAKGFRLDETHHEMFWFFLDGKKTSVRTRISHGEKEYGDWLLARVAEQMKLTKQNLLSFVQCTLDAAAYRKLLLDGGYVTPERPQAASGKKARKK